MGFGAHQSIYVQYVGYKIGGSSPRPARPSSHAKEKESEVHFNMQRPRGHNIKRAGPLSNNIYWVYQQLILGNYWFRAELLVINYWFLGILGF